MKWKKYTIHTTTEAEDIVSLMLNENGVEGVQIEDNVPLSDADTKGMFIDILPELPADDGSSRLSFFLRLEDDEHKADSAPANDTADASEDRSYSIDDKIWSEADINKLLETVRNELDEMRSYVDIGEGRIEEGVTEDTDWRDNWNQFFKPILIDKFLIKPSWEEIPDEHKAEIESGELKLIEIDPGTAFGTGSHETTQLCIRQLENYVTPELCISEEPLNVPWESCLTLGVDFTYEYGDHYKSPRELVGLLVNIVAKGGNMALNVSPQPDGRIPVDAWDSLNGFGQWMKTFGDAIYGTRVCAPYQSGTLSFTQKGDSVYVFRLYPTVQESVEAEIFVPYTEAKISELCMVENGETVAFKEVEGGLCITVPAGYRRGSAPIALVFEMKKER